MNCKPISYYVKVLKAVEVVVEVQAMTSEEARIKAESLPGVISAGEVMHWQEFERHECESNEGRT